MKSLLQSNDYNLHCFFRKVSLSYGLMLVLFSRLLGTATVPLKDLVKDSSHTMQADVNLLDANNRMTEVSESVDVSTDISVEHRSICRPTYRSSIGRYVDRCRPTYRSRGS